MRCDFAAPVTARDAISLYSLSPSRGGRDSI
jgi:hypothetical protein